MSGLFTGLSAFPLTPLREGALDERAFAGLVERLNPLWELFDEHGGSLRVVAAIAEHLGLAPRGCLPLPIQPLPEAQRNQIVEVVAGLGLA